MTDRKKRRSPEKKPAKSGTAGRRRNSRSKSGTETKSGAGSRRKKTGQRKSAAGKSGGSGTGRVRRSWTKRGGAFASGLFLVILLLTLTVKTGWPKGEFFDRLREAVSLSELEEWIDLSEFYEIIGGEPGQKEAPAYPALQKEADLSWQENLPPYSGEASVSINEGVPFFTKEEITTEAFEYYSELDGLGRCGPAFANICPEVMPTEKRGSIGSVRPTGWQTVKYDVIDDGYLYNRCHLIGFQLAGENANEKNLITGTRYLNIEGMLPWENLVADYVEETGYHVLYRVTPYFTGDNLVADGVRIEAYSVEDGGTGICFHVYCYNVQPGVQIDYATGDSQPEKGR